MALNPKTRADRRRAAVVAQAVAAGFTSGSRSGVEQSSRRRFLTLVATVVIAGTLLVGYTWADRQYEHPTTLDSWQNAYAVFDCQDEAWLAPFDSSSNPDGIRSRADGIIYIEPASDAVTGDNATLGVFLEAMGAQLSDDMLTLPDGTTLSEQGTFCGTEEAVLQVQRWDQDGTGPIETRLGDLDGTVFLANGQSLAIVLAPANATVPIPPSAVDLPAVGLAAAADGVDG